AEDGIRAGHVTGVQTCALPIWLTGFFEHWDKNTNAAHWFDTWFLNLFPRRTPFEYNSGGYETLNFIPSMATMALGLMAGELLRRSEERRVGKGCRYRWWSEDER